MWHAPLGFRLGSWSIEHDLSAIALRRVIDAKSGGLGTFPLVGARSASLDDIQLFLEGRVDDSRIGRLVRGLLSINWSQVEDDPRPMAGDAMPIHALVRIGYLPHDVSPLRPRLDATPLVGQICRSDATAAFLLTQRDDHRGVWPETACVQSPGSSTTPAKTPSSGARP